MRSRERISFKRLVEADLPMLTEWLSRPHVARLWDTARRCRTLDEVRNKYMPKLADHSKTVPYVAYLDGIPIGFIQSYVAMDCGDDWWPDERDPGVRGIDQFIADAGCMGRGVGAEMVREFVRFLFQDPAVTKIQADPRPENHRAIRCYEKVGFQRTGFITTPDGPALLMVLERSRSPA